MTHFQPETHSQHLYSTLRSWKPFSLVYMKHEASCRGAIPAPHPFLSSRDAGNAQTHNDVLSLTRHLLSFAVYCTATARSVKSAITLQQKQAHQFGRHTKCRTLPQFTLLSHTVCGLLSSFRSRSVCLFLHTVLHTDRSMQRCLPTYTAHYDSISSTPRTSPSEASVGLDRHCHHPPPLPPLPLPLPPLSACFCSASFCSPYTSVGSAFGPRRVDLALLLSCLTVPATTNTASTPNATGSATSRARLDDEEEGGGSTMVESPLAMVKKRALLRMSVVLFHSCIMYGVS